MKNKKNSTALHRKRNTVHNDNFEFLDRFWARQSTLDCSRDCSSQTGWIISKLYDLKNFQIWENTQERKPCACAVTRVFRKTGAFQFQMTTGGSFMFRR